jgi:predicted MPP superfamily phosphohydrolase
VKKLQLISDLHSEFYRGKEEQLIDGLPIAEKLDFLVVAGDTVVFGSQPEYIVDVIFSKISRMANDILLVTGNHEYYNSSKVFAEDALSKALRNYRNITWLDNEGLILNGVRFYGGTMWYSAGDGLNQIYEHHINDYSLIRDFNWAEKENAVFTANALRFVDSSTVVISHHMPHPACISPKYRNSNINRFFTSDQTEVITSKRPRLWFAGHTHDRSDTTVEDTRIIINPFGYPNENPGSYPQVILEV